MNNPLKEKIVRCFKEHLGDNLVSLVLFGSQARNEPKKSSDYDIFLVANELPGSPLKRNMFVREAIMGKFEEKLSLIAKTKEEVSKSFPPLFLDLGLDGVILYDSGFMSERILKIRQIIQEAGLKRVTDGESAHWEWKIYPKGRWRIDWEGVSGL